MHLKPADRLDEPQRPMHWTDEKMTRFLPSTKTSRPMLVLDVSSTNGSWSKPFIDRGHEVLIYDMPSIAEEYWATGQLAFTQPLGRRPDLMMVQPPCRFFSFAAVGTYWRANPKNPEGPYVPQREESVIALQFIYEWLYHIACNVRPRYWILESSVNRLRRLMPQDLPRQTTTYCRYNNPSGRRKATDFYGFPPRLWTPRPMCNPNDYSCHTKKPKGPNWIKGTSKDVPYDLVLDICTALEDDGKTEHEQWDNWPGWTSPDSPPIHERVTWDRNVPGYLYTPK